MIDLAAALRVYLVIGPEHVDGDMLEVCEAALRGGVTMVQLRSKIGSDRDLLEHAIQLQALCSRYNVPFLFNDRLDIALAAGADGIHLGVDDLPLEHARNLAGEDFIIGYSPETDDQLRAAARRGADYLGIGPIFGTRTKLDAGDALGLDEFTRRMRLGGLPTVGIGGISVANTRSVIATGAQGVAVVSAILGAADPEQAARQISLNSNNSSTLGSSAGSQ